MSLQCIQLKKKTAIAQVTDELQTFPERRSCGGHLGDNTLDFNLYLACLYQPTNLTNCMPGITTILTLMTWTALLSGLALLCHPFVRCCSCTIIIFPTTLKGSYLVPMLHTGRHRQRCPDVPMGTGPE